MKQTLFTALFFCMSLLATGQNLYQYAIDEPESSIQIEYTDNQDSIFIFTFTTLEGETKEVQSRLAYWRNGDFITIANIDAWLETSYRISGRVKYRKIKR